jgi:hypothetical protein
MLIKIAEGDPLVYTFCIKMYDRGGGHRNPRPLRRPGVASETPRLKSNANSDWTKVQC